MKRLGNIPIFLLAAAFALAGAKSPIAFCLWAFVALVAGEVNRRRKSASQNPPGILFFLFIVGIVLSQTFSLDASHSIYQSTQYLVFACLGLTEYFKKFH